MAIEKAGLEWRIPALLLDLLLVSFLIFGAQFLFGPPEATDPTLLQAGESLSAANAVLVRFLLASYIPLLIYFLPEALWGVTPGKLLLRLKVLDPLGQPPTRQALSRRYAIKGAPVIFWIFALLTGWSFLDFVGMVAAVALALGGMLALSTQQTLHDRLSQTAVFRQLKS